MGWGEKTTAGTVNVSKAQTSHILFANGEIVRQNESVVTTEYRGLDETNGLKEAASTTFSESYAETTYYKLVGGEVMSYTGITGTKTEFSGVRADDSGRWTVTKKVTTYSVTGGGTAKGWSTTKIDSNGVNKTLTTSGQSRINSYDKTIAYLTTSGTHAIFSIIETTNSEVKYVSTEAAAKALVAANTSNNITYTTKYALAQIKEGNNTTYMNTGYQIQVPIGTEKHAVATYVSPSEGWAVLITETKHDVQHDNFWR